LPAGYHDDIVFDMKQVLIHLDDELAEKLDRVVPPRSRRRSEFVRMALRKALWEAEERAVADAYRRIPDTEDPYFDPATWEPARAKPRKRRP
jgi:hypothetical protein